MFYHRHEYGRHAVKVFDQQLRLGGNRFVLDKGRMLPPGITLAYIKSRLALTANTSSDKTTDKKKTRQI